MMLDHHVTILGHHGPLCQNTRSPCHNMGPPCHNTGPSWTTVTTLNHHVTILGHHGPLCHNTRSPCHNMGPPCHSMQQWTTLSQWWTMLDHELQHWTTTPQCWNCTVTTLDLLCHNSGPLCSSVDHCITVLHRKLSRASRHTKPSWRRKSGTKKLHETYIYIPQESYTLRTLNEYQRKCTHNYGLEQNQKHALLNPPFFLLFLPQGDIEGPNGLNYWDVNSQIL